MTDADQIAAFILDEVRRAAPHRWQQAPRKPPLPVGGGEALGVLASMHVWKVSELATRGLMQVARGFPIELSQCVFAADRVLELQAQGRRCLTLLPENAVPPVPHATRLEFLLHDLRHLEKFAGAGLYEEQVGFFAALARAFADPHWRALEAQLDQQWQRDRDYVCSDMNGSCVFLWASLKMKLKMAARRRVDSARTAGPLLLHERAAFNGLLEPLLDAMRLPPPLHRVAPALSTRRDCPQAAAELAGYFRSAGVAVLRSQSSDGPCRRPGIVQSTLPAQA